MIPSKPPPSTNNFCLYPPPVLRCLWKDPLMTPTPHHPTSSIGGGVAGSEDFACATLRTNPFDFLGKVENFCHPALLKIRLKISVTPPPPTPPLEKGQSQNYGASINSNGLLILSGLLSLKFLLHMTTSFIEENHFNNCI